jgi:TM2 domain-containing membrane protein YozV
MPVTSSPMQQYQSSDVRPPGADKKIAAGICGILLGGFGVHKFILGYQQEGIILLAVTLVAWIITIFTCGIGAPLVMVPGIIGIVEGIIYLTKSDEDFSATYIVGKKPWF